MVYNWDQYEDICLELYINQNSTLGEIREYFKQTFGFSPSARAFQHHFHEWGFPAKREAAHRNLELVKRVEQLWEKNISHKEMLHILTDEGFTIHYKELKNLRRKNGWRLWTPRQDTPSTALAQVRSEHATSGGQAFETIVSISPESQDHGRVSGTPNVQSFTDGDGQDYDRGVMSPLRSHGEQPTHLSSTAPPGRGHYGAEDLAFSNDFGTADGHGLMGMDSQSESPTCSGNETGERGAVRLPSPPDAAPGQKTASRRKRERYKRDASGAMSRFPSEMTLDEARTALGLDPKAYARVRLRFQQVCEKEKVVKKTLAGPQKWDDLMARLVRTTPELSCSIPPPQPRPRPRPEEPHHPHKRNKTIPPRDADRRLQALDVICTDVTKRIRTAERRISMAGARTALGLNPREARGVRAAFEQVLAGAGIAAETCAVGSLDWDGLYRRWADRSDKVRALLGCAGEDREETLGLLLFVARDVIKRIKDHARRSAKTLQGSSAEQTATPTGSASNRNRGGTMEQATAPGDPADLEAGEQGANAAQITRPSQHAAFEQTAVNHACSTHAEFARTALPADPSHHMTAIEQTATFLGNPPPHPHGAAADDQIDISVHPSLSHSMASEQPAMPSNSPYHAAAFEQAAMPADPDQEAACIDGMDLGSWAHDLAPPIPSHLASLGFDQQHQMLGAGTPRMGVGAWPLAEALPVLGEPSYPILVHQDQIIFWYQNRWHVVHQ
ncbi:hypothetical protein ESCO_000524 [Escovopsis weberi]|uniref:Uncharacterized protein n=1 Tax=Escovopsis weberi TaxID=150374 RepID=A0A0N0RTD1_ESCWE|nr:hypothetical protein ESCO_000524 [Escovopsis weberi]